MTATAAALPDKGKNFSQTRRLWCGNTFLDLTQPVVMGILNITDDSFYDGGRYLTETAVMNRTEQMLAEGARIIDAGAISTRPGSRPLPAEAETERLVPVVKNIVRNFPEALVSVDTYRAEVARAVAGEGAHIINDISGGTMDKAMPATMAGLEAAYVLMHIMGTPENMQQNPEYNDVTEEVGLFFRQQLDLFVKHGKTNIILDPGFGFGKTITHNYTLLHGLESFLGFGYPLLVGVSRKSMIYKILETNPEEALNGTTIVNTLALERGAHILRVHDVKPAVEAIKIITLLRESRLNT